MRDSERVRGVLIAFEKGYRVLEDGSVLSHLGKKLKPHDNGDGYELFHVKQDGKKKYVLVHLLAAYQWFGEAALSAGIEIRHLDGNSKHNYKTNLDIGTHQQNMFDRGKEARIEHAKSAGRCNSRITEDQIRDLRKDRETGMKYKDLMKKYGLPKSTVSCLVNRKTYAEI